MSFPEPILNQWKIEALRRDLTLGEVILDKIGVTINSIEADFALFDKIAKKTGKFDAVKTVREERDRDDY